MLVLDDGESSLIAVEFLGLFDARLAVCFRGGFPGALPLRRFSPPRPSPVRAQFLVHVVFETTAASNKPRNSTAIREDSPSSRPHCKTSASVSGCCGAVLAFPSWRSSALPWNRREMPRSSVGSKGSYSVPTQP